MRFWLFLGLIRCCGAGYSFPDLDRKLGKPADEEKRARSAKAQVSRRQVTVG